MQAHQAAARGLRAIVAAPLPGRGRTAIRTNPGAALRKADSRGGRALPTIAAP